MNYIEKLTLLVQERFISEGADHDWYHIERVLKLAQYIQSNEGGDLEVVTCSALLHDISDHKLNGGKLNDNGRVAREILTKLNAPESIVERVVRIVDLVSYKGQGVADKTESLELSIVRDADRLDAIGAIGIARAFHFGGSRNRPFYDPEIAPKKHRDFAEYARDKSHTMNHFHEKLLLLFDRLETPTAKLIGRKRQSLMEDFVANFYQEWEVKV